jgi:4-amino-4-deoxy-L-arabinose transferase-like glycosyltransferase
LDSFRRSLLSPALRERFGEPSTLLAACVAGLWLVHPLQTESVTYLVQRVESLMGLFYLLTLYCAVRAVERDFANHGWTTAAVLACVLGTLTKEVAATAPLMVAAGFGCCGRQTRWKAARPLVGGLAAAWLILAVQLMFAPRGGSVGLA